MTVVFVGLALLAALFIGGESRKAQILAEYEADRIAAGLLDDFRSTGTLDLTGIDPRVLAFGIYRPDGVQVAGAGSAPESIDPSQSDRPFRYDLERGVLTLQRSIGMGGPAAAGTAGTMSGARMGRGMMGAGPDSMNLSAAHGGTMLLTMGVGSYYRARAAYGVASVAAPLAVLGIGVGFFLLVASNLRYRRRAEERERLALLGESARALAHEIRNPLGAIRIQTGLLRRGAAGRRRELDVIDEEVERLNLLARRVGEFLRSPQGQPEDILLSDFLRGLAQRSPYPVHLDGELAPVRVSFDPELLRSVVENLVRNAAESYSEDAGSCPVEMALTVAGRRVSILVRDQGKGIPPELAERVFDPFYTDKAQGSGVGLSLSRRFVEAAGGTLTLHPRPEGGTEARVTLPAGRTQ